MNTRRARAVAIARHAEPISPWVWAGAGVILLALAGTAMGQPVPEVVKPPAAGQSLTTPPTPGSTGGAAPRSENPLADSGAARPVPDSGVIRPPATGSMPVIPPPAAGTMPVIPPPGTAGGERGVVPK